MSETAHSFDHAARRLAESMALKPCPFDGGEARPFTTDGWWGVRCGSCGAQIGLLVDETKAADAWNRRLF